MPAPLGLHDSFTEEGFWWIAGREDDRVGGTLTFDPEQGARLNLLGMLDDFLRSMNAAFGADRGKASVIYGMTKTGKPVTLLKALNVNRQMNMPGIANETWSSNLLVIGLHIESDDQEIFSKSYSRFERIENWLGHRPFVATHDGTEKSLTVKASKPKEELFASHSDFEVTSVGSLYSSNKPDTRYTIEAISQFGVTPATPKSLNWHLSKATGLQELASLCTGHHLPLTSFELQGPEQNLGQGIKRPAEVHVYARMMHGETGMHPKLEIPIISGPELVSSNPGAVQRWFDQYEVFSPAIALFFTVTGERDMFVNVRFLLAIQALEVFHRRTSSDSVMSPTDFPAFAEMMTNAIPTSANARMKDKLKGAYRYLNEPSLGQRLRSIIADLTASFDTAPPTFGKAYVRKLIDTRNYYTHFSAELEDKTLNGTAMYWASRRIVLVLTVLFLQRLGLTGADLAPLLERHQEFSRLWTTEGDPF